MSLAKSPVRYLPAAELRGALVCGRGAAGVSEVCWVGRNRTFVTAREEAPGFNFDV